MSCKDIYNRYIENIKQVWKHRLTWCGLYGNMPKYSISLTNFLNTETANYFWQNISTVTDVMSYRKLVVQTVSDYVLWVQNDKQEGLSEEEVASLSNFAVGAFGEIFYICILSNINTLLVDHNLYHFINVSPLLSDKDFGIDGTATYSVNNKEIDCALQIKFWNPHIDTPITLKIAQGAFAQAVVDDIINPKENKNVIICWLGSPKNVSKYLKDDEHLYKKVVFIDMDVLDKNINNQVPFFWKENLPNYIRSII